MAKGWLVTNRCGQSSSQDSKEELHFGAKGVEIGDVDQESCANANNLSLEAPLFGMSMFRS
jgi:hypothetical protein